MARPPVEWPIPVYITELRERITATYRVPSRALASLIPSPLVPALAHGQALVSLSAAGGRCLKSVGGSPNLASEFRVAEVLTPVIWQGACRPAMRGSMLLALSTDGHGLRRLIRTSLDFNCERLEPLPPRAKDGCRHAPGWFDLDLPRALDEAPWPADSVFSSHEAAEAHLVHPECYFVSTRDGAAVNAVPVHQYARSTTHIQPLAHEEAWLARTLGVAEGDLELDHVFHQRRCTHTWSFPPERISTSRVTPRWATPADGAALRA